MHHPFTAWYYSCIELQLRWITIEQSSSHLSMNILRIYRWTYFASIVVDDSISFNSPRVHSSFIILHHTCIRHVTSLDHDVILVMSSLMFNHSTWYFVQCDVQSLDDRHTRSLCSMMSHVPSPEICPESIKIVVFSDPGHFRGGPLKSAKFRWKRAKYGHFCSISRKWHFSLYLYVFLSISLKSSKMTEISRNFVFQGGDPLVPRGVPGGTPPNLPPD
jgi:hypothetical protein